MTLFKNIFSVAALVAAISFTSFSATAQPVGKFVDLTNYEDEYVVPAMNVDLDEPFVFDRDYFEMFTFFMDSNTPYEFETGFEVSSVTMDGNDINFNFSTTDNMAIALKLSLLDEEQTELIKKMLAEGIYQLFVQLGEDDEGDTMIEKMQKLGINMNYVFFVDGNEAPAKSISLTAKYINQVGKNANMTLLER